VEIDLTRLQTSFVHLGSALNEAREALRWRSVATVRIRGMNGVSDMPLSWAVAGLAGLIIATMVLPARPKVRQLDVVASDSTEWPHRRDVDV